MAEHRDVNLHNSRLELVFEKRIPGLRVSEAVRHHRFIMRSRHVHETIELHFILEGQRLMFVDRETYRLSPHSAIVVNHNLIHKTSTAPGFPPDHHNFILQLDRSRFDQILRVAGLRGFDDFGDRFNGVATFNDSEWRLILAVISEFKAMCEEDKMGAAVSMEDAHAFLYLQALELASIFAKARRRQLHAELEANQKVVPETVVKTGVHQKVHEVALYLQTHIHESVSLEELAQRFFMSRSYLTRSFRNVTGFSVVEYMTYIRIQKAQQLLRESDRSITEIADLCGFGNITYFEKVFKTTTGHTPVQYRKTVDTSIKEKR
ncbi:helix-turn-helix domain-containing protein [Oribacterium sp. Sow4_G1_1]|uniref:helix-turn-helix domain-containing protein n=1 Tax=Oribacterium sp. Sow4_G1_1 TaxID=3438794 RepID=UPI003F9EA38B